MSRMQRRRGSEAGGPSFDTVAQYPGQHLQSWGHHPVSESESKTRAGERMELPGAPQRVNSRIRNEIRGLQTSRPPAPCRSYHSAPPAVGKTASFVRTFDKPYWEPDHAWL